MSIVDTMLEVNLIEEDDFLKVKETLTRIGVASKKDNKLFQSCHILHKKGKYYIVHFKEMFALDGKITDYTDEDISRRNSIAFLLQEWNLLSIISPELYQIKAPLNQIKIISHKDKNNWELVSKYTIGKKRN
jgi:hypothetical protein